MLGSIGSLARCGHRHAGHARHGDVGHRLGRPRPHGPGAVLADARRAQHAAPEPQRVEHESEEQRADDATAGHGRKITPESTFAVGATRLGRQASLDGPWYFMVDKLIGFHRAVAVPEPETWSGKAQSSLIARREI